jgi:Tfp pilus assembly protein PilN
MIRINLHDYRYEIRKIETQKRVVKCSAVIITAIFLILLSWLVEKNRLTSIKSETNKVKSQVAALQSQVKVINTMEIKQSRMETIIREIEGLREEQIPAGTIVSDLNMLIPEGLWLVSIIQKDTNDLRLKNIPVIMFDDPAKKNNKEEERKKDVKQVKEFIEVSGYALTEKEVVKYMQKLQRVSYYETTFLYKTARSILGGQSVYKFIIYCYMPREKNSA